jgi:hypothetical protein
LGPVRPELAQLTPRFELNSHVAEYEAELQKLFGIAVDIQRPNLDQASRDILALLGPALAIGGTSTAVGQRLSLDSETWEYRFVHPPYDVLASLGFSPAPTPKAVV